MKQLNSIFPNITYWLEPFAQFAFIACFFGCLIINLACPSQVLAHGVELRCVSDKAMVIYSGYSDGEVMSYAKIKIKRTNGKTYQVGNADAQGRFAFLPESKGAYTITVSDGMGHKKKLLVTYGNEVHTNSPSVGTNSPMSNWTKAIWGLCFIFFAFGAFFWIAGIKKSRALKQN